ncbi:uncharacterized protein TRIADDRAFT_61583 [Trichoplax adhaerens]|uniref:Uncharacterized protein n=1 Tax=Trichoplax adhaerens TaxID=10228 RepID=B3SBE2_TRIAD|nr:predicted protein [Trichoplax adhaerens]EDV19936.1 predicted protein [Trichoplax adhaerens]|eukprot:XP_002117526.1 predicted protein [Trichoplax adhaerens]
MLSPKSISMFAKSQQNSTAFPVEKEVLRDSRRSDDVNIGSELYSASTVFLPLPPATAALNRTRGQKSTAFRRSRVLAKALIDEVDGQDKPPTALHFGSIEAHFVGDYSPTSPSAEGKWTIDLPKSPEPNYEQVSEHNLEAMCNINSLG